MSKEKVFEIARKKDAIERDLKKFTKLKEEAFKVFDHAIWATLENIQKSCDSGAWHELRMWHTCHERLGQPFVKELVLKFQLSETETE